jgi:hypothetical protein
MIYLVTDGAGRLVHICESEQFALNYIALYGDESFTIDCEEMC